MIRILLASIFLYSASFAGLPPTTVKGMSESGKTTTFNVVTPSYQATTTGAATRLIETGNGNRLKNPNFLATSSTTSWTIGSGVTTVDDNTFYFTPNKSLQLTLPSGTQTNLDILSQTFTSEGGDLSGSNLEVSIRLAKSIYQAGIDLKLCLDINSVQKNCVAVPQTTGNTYFIQYLLNYPAANTSATTTYRIYLRANYTGISGSAAIISVQDAYLGPARNIGSGVPNNVFSAKVSSAGVVSDENEDFINGNCSVAGALFTCPVYSGKFNVTPNCTITPSMSSGAPGSSVDPTGTSSTQIRYQTFTAPSTSAAFAVNIICTRAGTDFIQPAITPNQWNYDWRAANLTTTPQGFGTVTYTNPMDCKHTRKGPNMILSCKFTAGTVAASEARLPLPDGQVINSASVPATSVVGKWVRNNTVANSCKNGSVLAVGGNNYIKFGTICDISTTNPLASQNGSSILVNGEIINIEATIPIEGWTENQNAPQLVGSVTSNSSSALRMEYLETAGPCFSSPCTIAKQSGAFTSMTRSASGTYTLNFPSGTWSVAPTCTCTSSLSGIDGAFCAITDSGSLTAKSILSIAPAGNAVDANGIMSVICIGPR